MWFTHVTLQIENIKGAPAVLPPLQIYTKLARLASILRPVANNLHARNVGSVQSLILPFVVQNNLEMKLAFSCGRYYVPNLCWLKDT